MITAIIQNVALLIAIVVVYQFVVRKWEGHDWQTKVILGLLFGAVGVVSMMTPYVFATGVVIDGRSIILGVAGFFGGPAIAAIAALICAGYRLSMGGDGTWVGLAVITTSSLIGVGFYYLRQRNEWVKHPAALWAFGLLIHLVMIVLVGFVPNIGPELARTTGPIVLVLFPLATLLACKIFLEREKQIENEAKLFASEERHRTTLLSIGDAVISTDAQGRVILMNRVAEELTGWKQEVAAGLPLETVFHIISETSREEVPNPAVRVVREGIVVGLANHTLLVSRDGTECPIADSAAPIRDSAGKLTGVVLVFRDQTAEREAEIALKESERRLSTLMSNLPGMVYRSRNDTDWTPEFVSDGCLDLTGYPAQDFLRETSPRTFTSLVHLEDRERIRNETRTAVEAGKPYLLKYRLLTANGEVKWVEERGRALFDDQGMLLTLEGCIFDVSEQRRIEGENKRLEEELRHAHKMEAVGRLAGGVAHDFNNMLSVINGYTELALSKAPADGQVRECLEAVQTAGQRSAELTQQLLAFARKQPIAPQIINVNETIDGMLAMLKRLIGENIRIIWEPGERVPSVKVDPSQLDQIMVNLVINARDAISPPGTITISSENFTLDETAVPPVKDMPVGSYATLSVSDDGRGIDNETLEHLFEPFFTTKNTGEGTGLGLATVYGIATQNHSFVSVTSEVGEGSTFRIYLPEHEDTQRIQPTFHPPPPADTEHETLLIVEDEEAILKLSRMHLSKLGYNVLSALSPSEAIQLAREHNGSIDLLITDVIMPEMNGHELRLRLNEKRPLKCLYVSGYTADIVQKEGILFDDVHFLQKPFTLNSLANKVREALTDSA